jgi:L-asparaginase
LCDAGVNITFYDHQILKPDFSKPMIPHTALDPNIVVFSLFPGIQENIVRHVLVAPELRSIVMRSYGSGNAPQNAWLMRLLKEASSRGVTVVNISQCVAGSVEMARYDAGYQLKQAGVLSGYDSTVECAVTKLMYLQARYSDYNLIRKLMTKSIVGEITV